MKDLILVGVGGFFGSIGRYGTYLIVNQYTALKGFYSTTIVNLTGCLLIGLLAGHLSKSTSQLNLLLMVGFCGGFTTFSSYALDSLKLIREGMVFDALLYTTLSVVVGLILCMVGFYFTYKV